MTSSVAGLRRSSKAFPKAKFTPRKIMVTVWLICCSFDPLQLSESQRNHSIWGVCSASQWDAPKSAGLWLALVDRMGPILPHDNDWPHNAESMLQKVNKLGCEILPHLPYSPDLLPSDYHFIKHLDNFFFRENSSTTSRRQKMLSTSSLNADTWIFTIQE